MRHLVYFLLSALLPLWSTAQDAPHKFQQLDAELPTPNVYRTASGAPGPQYWQQKADYVMDVEIDDLKQRLTGKATVTYHNASPDVLTYLWLQMDQNLWDKNSDTYATETQKLGARAEFSAMQHLMQAETFDGGFRIANIKDEAGKALPYVVNKTMMRVDLPAPLQPGGKYKFSIEWSYNINNQRLHGGRTGYEYFEDDDNYIYEIAQFFPRLAVYDDKQGWQHKQYLGRGEFALPFGDYEVNIRVPADFIVGSTGELQNAAQVLTPAQQQRFAEARAATQKPVLIVTEAEARANETSRANTYKTWRYKARNVRDFAFAASRKFIWDGMNCRVGDNDVLCMSYFPKEGNPLWEQYSTQSVAHAIKVYSRFTVDYNYPVAISVNGPVGGMEYPMICFNGPRPEPDGTYERGTKYGLISVIIHEVGHNFFPMIINSDERQWTWMDEGLNSFVQFLTEQEWERDYPSRRGPPQNITDYMKNARETDVPIMTNSESIPQFGNNAYGKPATALNILRETVMGRELFDYAFKEYCRRWAFRHPAPADFFRSMEDASGVDLDWFWRGWFYTTDHVDVGVRSVQWMQPSTGDPLVEKPIQRQQKAQEPTTISEMRNDEQALLIDERPHLRDFYTEHDPHAVTPIDKRIYERYLKQLTPAERNFLNLDFHLYEVTFDNVGGLVTPLIVKFTFADGTSEIQRLPAEIWRMSVKQVTKVFVFRKDVTAVELDPHLETADTDRSNNFYPPRLTPTRLELYKQKKRTRPNTMQLQQRMDDWSGGDE